MLLDSVRRVAGRRLVRLNLPAPVARVVSRPAPVRPARVPRPPSLQPGQLRRTRPDLPLIDAVDGLSDFIQCPHPGCCALRPTEGGATCPACHRL
ncbi:MAG TPA: hypothetical protein VHX15_09940 [Frankiaceae bacterium]|nr:hypothetical protein [Frankiaceae bacterium]